MPAFDSPEDIQRCAPLCLFIRGCKAFTRSLEDFYNANIARSHKVSDCLSINLYFMEVGDVQFYQKFLLTGDARITQPVTNIFVRFTTDLNG